MSEHGLQVILIHPVRKNGGISEYEATESEISTAPAITDEAEPGKAEETQTVKQSAKAKDKSMRVNFFLDEKRYKKLAILAVLEDTSLTALLKEGIDLCISAHETQSAIAEEAINENEKVSNS